MTNSKKKYDIKIDRQRATVPVPLGVKKYGLPFISKDISAKIGSLQFNKFDFKNDGWKTYEELLIKYPRCKSILKWWCNKKDKPRFNISSSAFLKEFLIENPPPFKISPRCCAGAKKDPSHKYEKAGNFDCKCMGLRRAEGGIRATKHKNCFTYDPHTGLGVIEYDAESGIIRINFGDEESVHIGYLPEVLIVGNIHDEEYKKLIKKPDAAKPEKPTRPVPGLKLIKGGKK